MWGSEAPPSRRSLTSRCTQAASACARMRSRQPATAVATCSAVRSASEVTGSGALTMTSCTPVGGLRGEEVGIGVRRRLRRVRADRGEEVGHRAHEPAGRVRRSAAGPQRPHLGRRAVLVALEEGVALGVDRLGRLGREAGAGPRGAAGGDDRPQPRQGVHAQLVHRSFSIPRCSMPSSSNALAVGPEARATVQRERIGLRVHADPARAGRARLALRLGQQRRAHTGPARARAHAQAPEARRPARLDQHPAGPDHLAAVADRHQVQRLVVEPVAVAVERHALLAAEDVDAQGERGGELLLVAGAADRRHCFR